MEEIREYVRVYIDYSSDFAMINENITYSIFIENTSDFDIKDFFVSINVPENTEYCDESLISSNNYVISNEASGIILDNLKARSTCSIFYKVEVIKIPEDGVIVNRNFIKYRLNNGNEMEIGSNILHTRIKGALIKKEEGFRKAIVDGQLKIGELITFEIIIKNTGNITAFDLYLTDILPRNIKPLLDKVIVNNRILTLKTLRDVSLGNLGPFKSLIIRYKAIVESTTVNEEVLSLGKLEYRYFNDFIGDYIDAKSCSNEILLNINEAIINEEDFSCEVDKNKYFTDEYILCTFKIRNSGNTSAVNSLLSINLANGIDIKDNVLIINGKKVVINNLNRINLGEIDPNKEFTVLFKGITKSIIEPEKSIMGTITYDYKDLEIGELVTKCGESNVVKFNVFGTVINNNSNIIDKNLSKSVCKIGDEIDHKVTLNNSGNLKCSNLIFNELNEYGQELIKGSFKVNGKIIDDNKSNLGILIGDINPGENREITYRSRIVQMPTDDFVRSRAYIEFNEGNRKEVRKKIWCKENEIEVVGAKIETVIKTEKFYNFNDGPITCSLNIRNIGNKRANKLNITLSENRFTKINKISTFIKNKNIRVNGNTIEISSLETLEDINLDVELDIDEKSLCNDIAISGDIHYFYFSDKNESKVENERCHIDKKYLKIFYPNVTFNYDSNIIGIEAEEEFSVNLLVENSGNVYINNIMIQDILTDGVELLYCSERVENNVIYIEELRVTEQRIITIVLKGKNDFFNNHINLAGKAKYGYFTDKIVIASKEIKPLRIEFINGKIDFNLVTEKNETILNETIYNSFTIKNNGTYDLKDAKLYIESNKISEIEVNDSFIINSKICKINVLDNSIELGDIRGRDTLVIKYNINSKTTNKIKLYGKLVGNYEFSHNREKREKTFYSNEIELKCHRVGLKSFLSVNKDIVYKGDKIKYSSVIINDGTVPIDFSFKMNVSKSLVEATNGFIVNGVIIPKENNYLATIEPSEGITIDEIYTYSNSFGGSKVFGESIINYSYSLDGNEYKNESEVKTERIFTEAASTTFKEVIIEHKEGLIDFEEELVSVSNIYVTPSVLNYYIVDRFKNINTNNEIISSTKVIVKGIINLNIEYISKTNNVYIHNKHLEFVTFMILPKEYKYDDKIEVKADLGDVYYKIIDLSYLFININLIIKALF